MLALVNIKLRLLLELAWFDFK